MEKQLMEADREGFPEGTSVSRAWEAKLKVICRGLEKSGDQHRKHLVNRSKNVIFIVFTYFKYIISMYVLSRRANSRPLLFGT